jgi:hypothetical protein
LVGDGRAMNAEVVSVVTLLFLIAAVFPTK